VRTPTPQPLGEAIAAAGGFAQHEDQFTLQVRSMTLEQVGHIAFVNNVELHELSSHTFDLEDLFFQLTGSTSPGAPTGMKPSQGSPGGGVR
jgi:ABC-2 type transport system ATP-binding protein